MELEKRHLLCTIPLGDLLLDTCTGHLLSLANVMVRKTQGRGGIDEPCSRLL